MRLGQYLGARDAPLAARVEEGLMPAAHSDIAVFPDPFRRAFLGGVEAGALFYFAEDVLELGVVPVSLVHRREVGQRERAPVPLVRLHAPGSQESGGIRMPEHV
ncbi:hypothetical protein SRIMM317S_07356 [Streptomyces rimosus subsp. rimosus]